MVRFVCDFRYLDIWLTCTYLIFQPFVFWGVRVLTYLVSCVSQPMFQHDACMSSSENHIDLAIRPSSLTCLYADRLFEVGCGGVAGK